MNSLLFLILFGTVGRTVSQNCPPKVNDEIQQCVTPVAQFAESLGLDVNSTIGSDRLMPNMGSQVFRQLCEKISTFSTCVHTAKRQCRNHITLTLISASYGYLCTEGYEVFLKNADCLMQLDQEESVRYCHDRTMTDIKNSTADTESGMAQKLTRMCHSLNNFTICVKHPILRMCGGSAWSVIARVLHDTTMTLMPTCKFAVPIPHERALSDDAVYAEQAAIPFIDTQSSNEPAMDVVGGRKMDDSKGRNTPMKGTLVGGASVNGPVGYIVIIMVLVLWMW